MPYNDQRKVIFLHVPKTGGTVIKQLFGIQDPQNGWSRGKRERKKPGPQPRGSRGREAVLRTVPLGWIAYALVIIWYLKARRWESDVRRARKSAPWYRHKSTPSFADMLSALRVELLAPLVGRRPRGDRVGRRAGRLRSRLEGQGPPLPPQQAVDLV